MTVFACTAFCLASLPAKAQVELINVTNTTWSYLIDETDLSTVAWYESDYTGADAWPTGLGLFGNDGGYPHPFNTMFAGPGGGGPYWSYYRTTFTWNNDVTVNPILRATVWVDDGFVLYLNGVEVDRYNVPDGPTGPTTDAISANPSGEPVELEFFYPISSLPVPLNVGENLIAVELRQAGTGSSDNVWGMQLDAVSGAAPVVTDPTEDQTVFVTEGDSETLETTVTGNPTPSLQWEFSSDSGATYAAIAGATGDSYTIGFMASTNAGLYRLSASNTFGTATSPVFDVMLRSDTNAPVLLSACSENGGNDIRIVFNEPVQGNLDVLLFNVVDEAGNVRASTTRTITGNELLMEGLIDAFSGVSMPLVDGVDYTLVIIDGDPAPITDLFGNELGTNGVDPVFGAPSWLAPVSPTVSFQQGVDGYMSTVDTEVRGNNPDANLGASAAVTPDGDDGSFPVHGLIRFDDILGTIPVGASIVKAEVTVWTFNQGSDYAFHRMLIPWQGSDTWNTLGAGVQADDVEASSTPDDVVSPSAANLFHTADVTATLQAIVNGEISNYGWAIISTGGTDGWDFDSSEAATVSQRPRLVVCYTVPEDTIPMIQTQPMDVTATEPATVTVRVVASGGSLNYQWRKDGVDIPGANELDYTIVDARPSDSGEYDVVVSNGLGTVTSDAATVTIAADTTAPTFVSASADGDANTVTLVFSEAVAAAAGDFSIEDDLGGSLAVNTATVQANGTDVVLEVGAFSLDSRYTLVIDGVTDQAETPNALEPSPLSVPLVVAYLLADFDGTWAYNTNGMPDSVEIPVPGWEAADFDDSAWLTGMGLFGFEDAGAIPGGVPINTPFTDTAATSPFIETYYFRTTVNVAAAPAADVALELNFLIDDGAVFYLNGSRAGNFQMPADLFPSPVAYTNHLAGGDDDHDGSVVLDSTSLVQGDNSLAVEVHQGHGAGGTSSDVLFGTQIRLLVGFVPDVDLSLTIEQSDTEVTVTWDGPPGTVLEAAGVVDGTYAEVVGATSPHVIAKPLPDDMQYFRLRAP